MDPTDWIELANRPTLWRLLWRLVEAHQEEPGHGVPLDDLVRATYPGEHLLPEAAANRIYYSIATLRKAGLRPVLQRREDGYLLDPSWELYEGVSGILSRRLPSNDRPTDVRTNLTPHATQFIHRRSLLERMEDHLKTGARLMVLQGPGGAGKTRLSREFGLAHQEDFEGGVWFCDLSAVQSGAALVAMVARVLSVPLSDSAGGDDGQLGTALKGRGPTLLILDNFERLTALATSILAPWLQDAPELRLLVTSRERLPLTQAQVIYVSSLTEEEALELLMDRGKAVRPGFEIADRELALKLLEGLDRLPLAVELAAARTNVLNLNQLYARLEDRFRLLRSRHTDRPPRQATMQATIDWSWNQATPIEALALAQCSTFRGSFTLEAAEAVLDLEGFPNAPWFEEVIESLVDQSLVQRQEPEPGVLRFRLLESVQDYAAARLRDPKAIVGPSHEALTGPEIAETL
ncbi:MAG: AAA family ATPase, partial [Myxococcota bacterium]